MMAIAFIPAAVGLVFFIAAVAGHHHQWLPWSRLTLDNKPLNSDGAYDGRICEISICATCSEAKFRMMFVHPEEAA